MTATNENSYDALIVGAGVIGLACAWRAARAGARVCVLEREYPAAGATGVAAGMLAPVGEASWGEETLLSLNLDSLRRWPDFASELEADAGEQVGYAECGALHVALDRDEAEALAPQARPPPAPRARVRVAARQRLPPGGAGPGDSRPWGRSRAR